MNFKNSNVDTLVDGLAKYRRGFKEGLEEGMIAGFLAAAEGEDCYLNREQILKIVQDYIKDNPEY